MNEREIGELRRHLRRDRCNMTEIYGCYVNDNREIIAQFRSGIGMMPENEAERYFGTLRKVLSGSVGKNLIDLRFQTSQVAGSPEHELLMKLRSGGLKDEEVRGTLFQKMMESISLEGNYLILVGCDTYDVPFKSKDGTRQDDSGDESYTYVICAVCPVKQTKPNLHYVPEEKTFHDGAMSQPVSAPELGFLFPAFDNRSTNIYDALYYTHNIQENQEAFLDAVFHIAPPKPAAEQKKCFEELLTTALGDECSMDVVQSVYSDLCERMALHKESKVPEPLLIDKQVLKDVLTGCGISEAAIAKFSVQYDEAFGFEAELFPKNIIDSKHFEIHTSDISVKLDPTQSDKVQTRTIGGVKYILINAEEDVEVNGVGIRISEEAEKSE